MPMLDIQKIDNWRLSATPEIAWETVETWQPGDALLLQVDDEPQAQFSQASAIAIDFPAFNDGRGLSLAVLLRTRYSYTGALWALGDINADLVHYLRRCGVDHIVFPQHREVVEDAKVLTPYSDYYQGSVVEPAPSYRRVSRGLAG